MPVLLKPTSPPVIRAGGCCGQANGDFLSPSAVPFTLTVDLQILAPANDLSSASGQETRVRVFDCSDTELHNATLTPTGTGLTRTVQIALGNNSWEHPGELHKLVLFAHGDETIMMHGASWVLGGANTLTVYYYRPPDATTAPPTTTPPPTTAPLIGQSKPVRARAKPSGK